MSWTIRPELCDLSPETIELVERVIAAHDDDDIDVDEMIAVLIEFGEHAYTLTEAERVEASLRIADHSATSVCGVNVRYLGYQE